MGFEMMESEQCELASESKDPGRAGSAPPALVVPTAEERRAWLLVSLPHLHKVARRMTRDPAEANDLVQATALKALENGHRFSGELPQFRRWLITVMHNLKCDSVRRQKAERLTPLPEELATPVRDDLPPVWRLVTDDSVESAIRRLPADLRKTYSLYAVEGLTYAEIAGRLGLPAITVGTRIHRARALLRLSLLGAFRPEELPPARSLPAIHLTVRPA